MITDAEMLAIRAFDRTLVSNRDHAQAIINKKNRELEAAGRIIAKLQADLAASEARHEALRRQITYAATH